MIGWHMRSEESLHWALSVEWSYHVVDKICLLKLVFLGDVFSFEIDCEIMYWFFDLYIELFSLNSEWVDRKLELNKY